MKAALLDAYHTPWQVREVPTPEPGQGEVLVEVAGAGACHSDLSVMMGKFPIIDEFPMILGHENAGRVVALGPGVDRPRRGRAGGGVRGLGLWDLLLLHVRVRAHVRRVALGRPRPSGRLRRVPPGSCPSAIWSRSVVSIRSKRLA